jgi:hypothetical protein
MTYIKRILGLTVVMALTAFAAPALADNNPISADGYSSPSSLAGADEQSRHPMSGGDYSSPSSIVGSGEPVTEPMSSGDYNSPSSLVGPTPEQPIASSDPTDSGFDWTDGLLGLVAGIALAAAALAATRGVKDRRIATSSF